MDAQKRIFIPKPPESPAVIEARWRKKKQRIEHLSSEIKRLRLNISKTLNNPDDEKEFLTALVIALMDRTFERIGNNDSAENGHYGVSGWKKNHISISGNKITLAYTGKSGVAHEKTFSDERLVKALKRAIKNSPSQFVFETSDGFRIKADRVNRILKDFGINCKDLRGFGANRLVVEKLKRIEPEETDKKRKKQINAILKFVAGEVGHGKATLKKHYLVPELYDEFVQRGVVIDLNDMGDYIENNERILEKFESGGDTDNYQRRIKAANEFGKILGKHIDQRGNILVGDLSRDAYEMMQDLHGAIRDYADNDEDVADYTIESFELNPDSIKDKKKFGAKISQYLNNIFDDSDDICETEVRLNRNGGYNYIDKESKIIAHKAGVITFKKGVTGSNCSNCIFQRKGFCDHKEVLLPVTKRMCCRHWDDKTLKSVFENLTKANFLDYYQNGSRSSAKLNALGGYDYSDPTELKRTESADLITLPEDIDGTSCAYGNCKFSKQKKECLACIHPKIKLPVTNLMTCSYWDNDKVKRSWGKPVEIEIPYKTFMEYYAQEENSLLIY